MRTVAAAADLPARRPHGAIGGEVGVRRRRDLPRAPHHRAASHRDPDARRRARHRAAVRRARVLDPAAPPEGRGGVAVDRARPGETARDRRVRRAGRAGGRLHERRHDRVPARSRRQLLFSRDEHAAAGGASGHRAGDGDRPRALAAAHRDGREADDLTRAGDDAARARDRVPHLRRRSGPRLHARARARAGAVRAVGARRPRRPRRRARLRDPDLLRLDDRQARRLGRHRASGRSTGSRARSTNTASSACRRRCRSSGG